jgi:hypothetical protein
MNKLINWKESVVTYFKLMYYPEIGPDRLKVTRKPTSF